MFELRKTDRFDQWLLQLRDPRAKVKVAARLNRLELGLFGDVKPVGSGISELRLDYGPGYRIYFVQRGGALIILLCGGDKGSQQRDIREAISLSREL